MYVRHYYARFLVRTLSVLAVVFIAYGGVGVVFDMYAGRVHAATLNNTAFEYQFSTSGALEESRSAAESSSPAWWLLSGGRLIIQNGVGRTLKGELVSSDPLHGRYAASQPTISDSGAHPQNNFQLLTQSAWGDARQEVTVTILDHNLSNASNRHPWNGIDVVSRYVNSDNFYFASIREDGSASIKKRHQGTYHVLDTSSFVGGEYSSSNPALLPEGQTMRLALESTNNSDGSVSLRFFVDKNNSGTWQLIADAKDSGAAGAPIKGSGRAGIFSDFMDLQLDNFRVLTAAAAAVDEAPSQSTTGGYGLSSNLVLEETGSMSSSPNANWWVNSGAYFKVENGIGKTSEGNLPSDNKWRLLYASSNPRDTDNGYHPQNIFRLLTKQTWNNLDQQAYFMIKKYNLSDSYLRDAHNALLFFNRYKDGNNLYYTGIRVDGKAVIKKKINGTYYTLRSAPVFSGTYNRSTNPNLIPTNQWIGIRSVVKDNADGSVSIKVYADTANNGSWKLVAEATDNGSSFGPVIKGKAYAGIRTDYMDAHLKGYSVKEI